MPILSTQAKTIIGRMTSTDLEVYEKVKQFLLTEFRLTPKEYKLRFDTATKSANETLPYYVHKSERLTKQQKECMRHGTILLTADSTTQSATMTDFCA